ncbi:hypothetical protein pb186bvf_009820 [Paramecium bursaria]
MGKKQQQTNGVDVEADFFEEQLDDGLVQTLQTLSTKAVASNKEKIRKIIEFKSRVLEMVEIIINQSKDPKMFLEKILPFTAMIGDFNNPQKLQFIRRICNILQSLIQKSDFTENIENLQLCTEQITKYIHKCQDKSINQKLMIILELLLKSFASLNTQQTRAIIKQTLIDILTLMRKNTHFQTQFVRKLLVNYSKYIGVTLQKLVQLVKIGKRSNVDYLSIITSLFENKLLLAQIIQKEQLIQALKDMISYVINNIDEEKHKKVALFRRLYLIIRTLQKNGVDLSEELNQFKSEDQNLVNIHKNLVK